MNKKLKIFTMTALLGVLTAGCANSNANINSFDKNLMNLETSVRNSIAGNASDFFINEFDCPTCESSVTAKYNVRTNVLEIGPTIRESNTRPLINKNVDTYRSNKNRISRNTTNSSANNTANANSNTNSNTSNGPIGTTFYRSYFITDGSYTPRYSELRDESVVANKVKNIENLYSIAYDVSLAKAQFNELRNELLEQIETTRNNLETYENLNEAQQAALNEYALTIRNIINTINNSNNLYKNNMVITGTQNVIDNQAYRSAQYINMLNCIDTQISALENAIATLDMINNSILNNAENDNPILSNNDTTTTDLTNANRNNVQNPTIDSAESTTKTGENSSSGITTNQNTDLNNTTNSNNNINKGIVPNIDTMDSSYNRNRVAHNVNNNVNGNLSNTTQGLNANSNLTTTSNANTPINGGRNISNMPYNSNMKNNSANGINNTVSNNANASTNNANTSNANNGVVNNANRTTANNANRNVNNGIVPNIDTMDRNFNRNTVANNSTNTLTNASDNVGVNNNRNNAYSTLNNGTNNNFANNLSNNGLNGTAYNLDGTNSTESTYDATLNNNFTNGINNSNGTNINSTIRNTDTYNNPTVRNNVNTYNYNSLGGLGSNRVVNGKQNLPSNPNTLLNNQTPPPTAERYMNNGNENRVNALANTDQMSSNIEGKTINAIDKNATINTKSANTSTNQLNNDIQENNSETERNRETNINSNKDARVEKNEVNTKIDTTQSNKTTNNTIKRPVNAQGPKVDVNNGKDISSTVRA